MEIDELTGEIIDNTDKLDIVASIYDKEGNHCLIGKNKKVYLKKEDGELIEINDHEQILKIFKLFRTVQVDVERDEDRDDR